MPKNTNPPNRRWREKSINSAIWHSVYDDRVESLLTSCYGEVWVHSKSLYEKEDTGWKVGVARTEGR